MDTGLSARDIRTIEAILDKYSSIRNTFIFGSRAKGTFSSGSDVDLAIMDNGVTENDLRHLQSDLEDSNLPYFVDIVYYPTLTHKELINHIDRVGRPLYQKDQRQVPIT